MEVLIPKFTDILDILIIAFILYRLVILLKKAGGYQVLIGLIVAVVIYFTATLSSGLLRINLVKDTSSGWVSKFIIKNF